MYAAAESFHLDGDGSSSYKEWIKYMHALLDIQEQTSEDLLLARCTTLAP